MRRSTVTFYSYIALTFMIGSAALLPRPVVAQPSLPVLPERLGTLASALANYRETADLSQLRSTLQAMQGIAYSTPAPDAAHSVPFFSQFADISAPKWRKVGCGIASIAMLIDYYEPGAADVDALLHKGIESNAFLSDAGWTHAGLINLTRPFGLTGESRSLSGISADAALERLRSVVEEGPVMASVHYTFDPQNPIPHLVVVTGVDEEYVYYNDPAEPRGGGVIEKEQFQLGWKQRYISIRPNT